MKPFYVLPPSAGGVRSRRISSPRHHAVGSRGHAVTAQQRSQPVARARGIALGNGNAQAVPHPRQILDRNQAAALRELGRYYDHVGCFEAQVRRELEV